MEGSFGAVTPCFVLVALAMIGLSLVLLVRLVGESFESAVAVIGGLWEVCFVSDLLLFVLQMIMRPLDILEMRNCCNASRAGVTFI